MFHSDNYVDYLCAKVQANRLSSVVTWLTHDHTITHTKYHDMIKEFADIYLSQEKKLTQTSDVGQTVLTSPLFTLLVM